MAVAERLPKATQEPAVEDHDIFSLDRSAPQAAIFTK
jgi:hypothetical protein